MELLLRVLFSRRVVRQALAPSFLLFYERGDDLMQKKHKNGIVNFHFL